jgi:hypothetical protein
MDFFKNRLHMRAFCTLLLFCYLIILHKKFFFGELRRQENIRCSSLVHSRQEDQSTIDRERKRELDARKAANEAAELARETVAGKNIFGSVFT